MKRLLVPVFVFCLAIGLASPSNATFIVPNGGFETGTLTSWRSLLEAGHASVVDAAFAFDGTRYIAPEGEYFARLAANSRIRSTRISWEAGDVLEFDWAFLAMDRLIRNDFATVFVRETDGTMLFRNILSSVRKAGRYQDTGWQEYSYTFAEAGTGFIFFDSINRYDTEHDSLLLVDFVHDPPPAPVPEPATMLLLGCGLIGLVGYGRKRLFK